MSSQEKSSRSERSLSSVLCGIKRLISRKGKLTGGYRDSHFKQYWMPDSDCKECYDCGLKFHWMRRRHHCRVCGQVFCSSCSTQTIDGQFIGYKGALRCCDYCVKVVRQCIVEDEFKLTNFYTSSPLSSSPSLHRESFSSSSKPSKGLNDDDGDGDDDDDEYVNKDADGFEHHNASIFDSKCRNSEDALDSQFEDAMSDETLQESDAAQDLKTTTKTTTTTTTKTTTSLLSQHHLTSPTDDCEVNILKDDRDRLRGMDDVEAGSRKSCVVVVGAATGKQSQQQHLQDSPPQPQQQQPSSKPEHDSTSPAKFYTISQKSSSSFSSSSSAPSSSASSSSASLNGQVDEETGCNKRRLNDGEGPITSQELDASHTDEIKQVHREHLREIIRLILRRERLERGVWEGVVMGVSEVVCRKTSGVMRHSDNLDVRKYLKIKKVLEGCSSSGSRHEAGKEDSRGEWMVMDGLAMTKTLSHKPLMATSMSQPRVLLIDTALQYQRLEGKYSSLEPQILQEQKYLENLSQRLISLQPNIVFSGRSVAWIVQQHLLLNGIALVLNVKRENLERLNRLVGGHVVTSVDEMLSAAEVGSCHEISFNRFTFKKRTKTLMCIKTLHTGLYSSVVVKARSTRELAKVKRCIKFVVYALHHMKAEVSLLNALSARIPHRGLLHWQPHIEHTGSSECQEFGGEISYKMIARCSNGEKRDGRDNDEGEKDDGGKDDDNGGDDDDDDTVTNNEKHGGIRMKSSPEWREASVVLSISPFVKTHTPCYELVGPSGEDISHQLLSVRSSHLEDTLLFNGGVNGVVGVKNTFTQVEKIDKVNMNDYDVYADDDDDDGGGGGADNDVGDEEEGAGDLLKHNFLFPFEVNIIFKNMLADYRAQGCMGVYRDPPLVGYDYDDPIQEDDLLEDNSEITRLNTTTSALEEETDREESKKNGKENINKQKEDGSTIEDGVEGEGGGEVDCLDLLQHQRISILFYSFSHLSSNFPSACVLPWIVSMEYYSDSDISLGAFLHRYCFNQHYKCVHSRCGAPMSVHTRRFVHGEGCVEVSICKDQPIISEHALKASIPPSSSSSSSSIPPFFSSSSIPPSSSSSSIPPSSSSIPHSSSSSIPPSSSFSILPSSSSIPHSSSSSSIPPSSSFSILPSSSSIPPSSSSSSIPPSSIPPFSSSSSAFSKHHQNIHVWTHCEICDRSSPRATMTRECYNMSLAKYLEMRFREETYLSIHHSTILTSFLPSSSIHPSTKQASTPHPVHPSTKAHKDQSTTNKLSHGLPSSPSLSTAIPSTSNSSQTHPSITPSITPSTTPSTTPSITPSNDPSLLSKHPSIHHSSTYPTILSSHPSINPSILASSICNHSINRHQLHIFQSKTTQACFRYIPVRVYSIQHPHCTIPPPSYDPSTLCDDAKVIRERVEELFERMTEVVQKVHKEANELQVLACMAELRAGKSCFLDNLEHMDCVIEELQGAKALEERKQLYDAVVQIQVAMRRQVVVDVKMWTEKLTAVETEMKKGKSSAPKHPPSTQPTIEHNLSMLNLATDDLFIDEGLDDTEAYSETYTETYTETYKQAVNLRPSRSLPHHPQDSLHKTSTFRHSTSSSTHQALDDSSSAHSTTTILPSAKAPTHPTKPPTPQSATPTISPPPPPPSLLLPPPIDTDAVESVSGSTTESLSVASDYDYDSKAKSKVNESLSETTSKVKQLLSSFLSHSSTLHVPDPTPPDEHCLLEGTDKIVVYESELSSIIAYALSSQQYSDRLKSRRQTSSLESSPHRQGQDKSSLHFIKSKSPKSPPKKLPPPSKSSSSAPQAHMAPPSSSSSAAAAASSSGPQASSSPASLLASEDRFESVDIVKYTPKEGEEEDEEEEEEVIVAASREGVAVDDSKQKQRSSRNSQVPPEHIEIQFSDCSTKFTCKLLYAEKFSSLRKLLLGGDESFIHSLSRSVSWRVSGGKSGSSFAKTRDSRFFLKQMSPREVQSFMEFAPHYVDYVTTSYQQHKSTTLAKIVGVYRVEFERGTTGRHSASEDLLVIENLFCGRSLSQVYDLKGSMRNRLASTCVRASDNNVLLDENLVRSMPEKPLYTRVAMKRRLMEAIAADTRFLCDHSVMDYSLLVGVDETNKLLVVGIIDYVRTFTWEKRMEMIIKTTCGKKMPTVQDPEVYRQRFLESMHRYLLDAPSMWHPFSTPPPPHQHHYQGKGGTNRNDNHNH